MTNIYFFGCLPNPATKLQLIIQTLNYNSLVTDVIIVTLLLWLLYVIVLVAYSAKTYVDTPKFYTITETIFKFGIKHFKLKENKVLEFIWTIIPAIIIVLLIIPSIIGTYAAETIFSTTTPVKIIGNQWFWTYERSVMSSISQDISQNSFYNVKDELLLKQENSIFLLNTEKHVVLPVFNRIPFIVTSNDVIHSFALPECGIKIDALPGRLNQVYAEFTRVGNFVGMCSELCGVGHAKMPINITVVSNEAYFITQSLNTNAELDYFQKSFGFQNSLLQNIQT